MANEIQVLGITADLTVYVTIFNSSAQVWDVTNSQFTTYVDANIGDYDVVMTELGTSSGNYAASFPTTITTAGTYNIVARSQGGGSPSVSDTVVATGSIAWDGDQESDPVVGSNNWETIMTAMVRVLIGDPSDGDTEFSDARIKDAIVVGALISTRECELATTYTFDVNTPDISPDPVVAPDNLAMALWSLKAACLLNTNRYQTAVSGGTTGVRVKDGDTEVDTKGSLSGFKDIMTMGPCKAYEELCKKTEWQSSMSRGKAVMTPLTHVDANDVPIYFGRASVAQFFDDVLRSVR